MTLHLAKICVGAKSVDDLSAWHDVLRERARETGSSPQPFHDTRMFPRRAPEILDGGSLYWTINSKFAVRQRITELEPITAADGTKKCRIHLGSDLILVEPVPKRPFQGWRYLEDADAPKDVRAAQTDSFELHRTLSELGLL